MDLSSNGSIEEIELPSKEARTWASLCHIAVFSGFLIPFGNVLGPLVLWLVKKNEFAFVEHQGKEALNFHFSMLIYILVSLILVFVGIGIVLLFLFLILNMVLSIKAALAANQGQSYRYPITIRFLK